MIGIILTSVTVIRGLTFYQGKSIKTISFIPAPATMRELTLCQVKSIKTVSFIPASATIRELTAYQAKSIKTVSFIPAPATIREFTSCQAKSIKTVRSFQLQPPSENLQPVKSRHQDCQVHSSSSHHQRTHPLSRQEHQDC